MKFNDLIRNFIVSTIFIIGTVSAAPSVSNYDNTNGIRLVVVTNKDTSVTQLDRKDVVNIYMGKYFSFGNGESAIAFDFKGETELKADFYRRLTGLSLARVNAYWSRIKFTGRARPPKGFAELDDIKSELELKKGAFAYMHESDVTDSMKVVFRFDK